MKRALVSAFLLLVPLIALSQQQTSDVKLRLAQSYERSGNYETAMKLYEELFKKDTVNDAVFDALRRMYMQLKKYDTAATFILRRVTFKPSDISLWAELGTVYTRLSDDTKAQEAWDRAIAVQPSLEYTYRAIADQMVENRLFDRAIAVYQRGRKACGNGALFTPDIAYMYSLMLNYADATREYLTMLRDDPNLLAFIQSRIVPYTGRADGLKAATAVVEQGVHGEPGNVAFLQLLAWLYMEGKRFENAYEAYRSIDEKHHASGRDIYFFADRALREKAYDVAARAFQEIINKYPGFPQIAQAKFGYARTLEESNAEHDTLPLFGAGAAPPAGEQPVSESGPTYKGVLAAYNRVVTEYPALDVAAQSLLRMAVILEERYFNLDEARGNLERIGRSYGKFLPVFLEAKLRLGGVYLMLNRIAMAESTYRFLGEFRPVNKNNRERALLELARLHYYRERFKDALAQLGNLTKDPRDDVTNDALDLQIFIQENTQPNDSALRVYAQADLLMHQRKLSEALAQFLAIPKAFPASPLVDEALITTGEILAAMKRYPEAIEAFRRTIDEFPQSIMVDRAYMDIGRIYQYGLNEKAKAVESYQALLEKFPNSLYVSEARRRIREMRGDAI